MASLPKQTDEQWLELMIARGAGRPFSEPHTLTPTIAMLLLARNERNRDQTRSAIYKRAADIEAGRYVLNGQPIIVSRCGLLLDGQHRCEAVIKTGFPVETFMTFGISRDAQDTMDTGKPRDARDLLSIGGVKNASHAASIARMALSYDAAKGTLNTDKLSPTAVAEFYRANAHGIDAATSFGVRHQKNLRGVETSVVGFCFYILNQIDNEAAGFFMTSLCTGEMLSRRDPELAARNRLLDPKQKHGFKGKVEIVFRAWLARRQGRTLQRSQVMGGIPNPGFKIGGR
jgi:hypothetical protein